MKNAILALSVAFLLLGISSKTFAETCPEGYTLVVKADGTSYCEKN